MFLFIFQAKFFGTETLRVFAMSKHTSDHLLSSDGSALKLAAKPAANKPAANKPAANKPAANNPAAKPAAKKVAKKEESDEDDAVYGSDQGNSLRVIGHVSLVRALFTDFLCFLFPLLKRNSGLIWLQA